MDITLLVGRIIFGGYFMMMGMNHFSKHQMLAQYAQSKRVPAPGALTYLTGAFLLLGGLSILLGAYLQVGVALLVTFLIVAAFKMHDFWTVAEPMQKMTEMIHFLRNIAYVGALLMILAIPTPWAYSLGF